MNADRAYRLDAEVSIDGLDKVEQDNGIVIYRDATILREGPMPYRRAGDSPEVRWEHVSADEIETDILLASAVNTPITDGHPPSFLTDRNISREARGISARDLEIVTVDDPTFGEVSALNADLIIFDPRLADRIDSGDAQISTGRRVEIVEDPGTFRGQAFDVRQTQMEINHIAVVDEGRCGETCSIDEGGTVQAGISFEAEDVIREVGSEWCIFSNDGERLECLPTREEAVQRLQEIEFFKQQDTLDQSEWSEFVNQKIEEIDQPREEVVGEVAQLSSRSTQEVLAIAGGVIRPPKAVVDAFAQVLGVPAEDFLKLLPFETLETEQLDSGFDGGNNTREEVEGLSTEDGTVFASWFNNRLDERAGDDTGVSDVVGTIADRAERSPSAINKIRTTSGPSTIDCPEPGVLEAVADVFDVALGTVVKQARKDGCSYSQNDFKQDVNFDFPEDNGMSTLTLEIADSTFELDPHCEDCEQDFQEFIEDVQEEAASLERELVKTEAALDQTEDLLEEKKDQLEELEQEPGMGPEGEPGGGQDEDLKIRLIMAIRDENPDYSFVDGEGNVKSTEQVMKDALEILGGVDLEEAADEFIERLEDPDYLRARVDVLLEDRSATPPTRDPEDVKDKDPAPDSIDIEEIQDLDLEELEDIDPAGLAEDEQTVYYRVLTEKRRNGMKSLNKAS